MKRLPAILAAIAIVTVVYLWWTGAIATCLPNVQGC